MKIREEDLRRELEIAKEPKEEKTARKPARCGLRWDTGALRCFLPEQEYMA